jgi:hypothetical protein
MGRAAAKVRADPTWPGWSAGIDCQRGRYAQGIETLEDLLQRNRIAFPPG